MLEATLFYTFSLLAITAGVLVVTLRNPISSAIALVASFFCLSAIYALLGAHFVAVVQVLVYAGAIMVLFLFVIMLLNLREETSTAWGDFSPRVVTGFMVAGLLGGGIIIAMSAVGHAELLRQTQVGQDFGTIEAVGRALFAGRFLLPFEAVSALLTVGVVGAVVLAKRDL